MKHRARMQRVLYATFLVTGSIATILGLLMIWGLDASTLVVRVLASCVVIAAASAFTMSATRLVSDGLPEDMDG